MLQTGTQRNDAVGTGLMNCIFACIDLRLLKVGVCLFCFILRLALVA